jgi:uncharacterized protein YndB with AHSA1/START domain
MSQDQAERAIVITRIIDAPADLVFEAHSKPEHVIRWFGPKGWPLTLCEMDFRVGGRFRFAMTGPSGEQNTPFGGEYLEIVPGRKIVYDNAFEEPGSPKFVVTLTFDEAGGQTTLTVHSRFDTAATRDAYAGMGFAEGTNSGLDNLEAVVADLKG